MGKVVSYDGTGLSLGSGEVILTTAEIEQLQNIGALEISATELAILASLDQALATTDEAEFESLTINNLLIDANDISSTSGDITLTPVAGGDVIIDGHFEFDGNLLTALTDNDTVLAAYAGKSITVEGVKFDGNVITECTNMKIGTGNPSDTFNVYGFGIKRYYDAALAVNTGGATTTVGLTPGGVILTSKFRVATAIEGLDSADHHLQLGIAGTTDKYIDVAQGAAATEISINKKGHYNLDPTSGLESAALILTITGGGDQTPTGGTVELEVIYITANDFDDV